MWKYSLVSYAHIGVVILMFAALITEILFVKKVVSRRELKIISRADMLFGIFAGLTAAFGLLRVYHYGKGADYYLTNDLFLIKVFAFILVGLLSIYPTLTFVKAKRSRKESMELTKHKTIKLLLLSEAIVLLFIPLLATLVANGVGMHA